MKSLIKKKKGKMLYYYYICIIIIVLMSINGQRSSNAGIVHFTKIQKFNPECCITPTVKIRFGFKRIMWPLISPNLHLARFLFLQCETLPSSSSQLKHCFFFSKVIFLNSSTGLSLINNVDNIEDWHIKEIRFKNKNKKTNLSNYFIPNKKITSAGGAKEAPLSTKLVGHSNAKHVLQDCELHHFSSYGIKNSKR